MARGPEAVRHPRVEHERVRDANEVLLPVSVVAHASLHACSGGRNGRRQQPRPRTQNHERG